MAVVSFFCGPVAFFCGGWVFILIFAVLNTNLNAMKNHTKTLLLNALTIIIGLAGNPFAAQGQSRDTIPLYYDHYLYQWVDD